ncbi:AAA family ATPase [Phaeobacter inhibens]|uniref:AAA family ATPase n=1 Tax=Phaeobacter inhibens TaxID=221822 RepID=UPI0021A8EBC5|nr:AAA family ATPase [Phaeobacter inhibens]UWR92702.1 AAA family ATPase [Phaeobacter inhibens]
MQMFKKITNIQNLGVFHNFSGAALPEFAPFNLIYGWNYSGKTTLSRMFRCLENSQHHPDYTNASFSLEDMDGTTHDQRYALPCIVRVFNEDFRKENLLWDEADGFNPIFLLGSENIDLTNDLNEKEAKHAALVIERDEAGQEVKKRETVISKAETDCATQISKELPVGRFIKTSLRPIFAEWNGFLPPELDAETIKTTRAKVSAEQKQPIKILSLNTEAIDGIWKLAVGHLTKEIGSSETISRLVDHPEIGAWVEEGHNLHKDKDHCEFCEAPLSPERLKALNEHFSDEFERLKSKVTIAISELEKRILDLSPIDYPQSAFYVDFQDEYSEIWKELDQTTAHLNNSLQKLIEALNQKNGNPFEKIQFDVEVPNLEPVKLAVKKAQSLIQRNNDRTEQFSKERDDAIETLKRYYASEAMRKIDRFKLLAEIQEHKVVQQSASTSLAALEAEISSLQAQLSQANKGAVAINDTLVRFFGKADLQVKVTQDDKYVLMRGTQQARNLSEGERTAIAFCYFVTKLQENGNELADTVVYIDDPISSLDSHHLLHINAFIRDTFYKFDPTANPKHTCLAKQLFVSTHNYEFFHLTWDWMSKMKKEHSSAFLIERTDANGLVCSRIIECPDAIKLYRSEYLFLFHQLSAYQDAPSNDPQVIFNLGNMARRFIEGYLAFKLFEHVNVDSKLDQIITDPVNCERARKFMHFYSHTLNRAGGMRLPDMSEAQAVVSLLLDAVRDHDPIHYGAMAATR